MDVRKISLYLSGKTPPYKKYSRLEFFEHLEDIFDYKLDKLEFYWKQAREFEEEFYYLVFEKLYSKSKKNAGEKDKLDNLLLNLDLPSEIYKNSKGFNYKLLKENFEKIIKTKTNKDSGESQIKGKQFEKFLKDLFNEIDGFEVTEIKEAEDEQIDLIIKNNINKPFWNNFNSPIIIGEAKNYSTKTPVKELDILLTKLGNHNNLSKIGFFIAMNGFTEPTDEVLKRQGTTDKILVKITGEDIEELLEKELNAIDWLEGLVMRSFI